MDPVEFAKQQAEDSVNPPHYRRFEIEPIEFVMKNHLSYAQGNIIKYICRYDMKGGLSDLLKARNYLDRMIEEFKDAPPFR
jgi:hypothetical protein